MLEQSKQLKNRLRHDFREIKRLRSLVEELKSESAKQALHLAGAIMLLRQARNGIDVDTVIFAKIDRFLKHEVNAE